MYVIFRHMNKKVQNFVGLGLLFGGLLVASTVFASPGNAEPYEPDVHGPRAAAKVDNDRDGHCSDHEMGCFDCNDANPAIHPGATEACNFIDDNCDGVIDTRACLMIAK